MRSSIVCSAVLAGLLILMTACGPRSPMEKMTKAAEKAQAGDLAGAIADMEEIKKMELDDATYARASMMLGTLYAEKFRMENDQAALDKARQSFEDVQKRVGVEHPNPQLAQFGQSATVNLILYYIQTNQPQKALTEVEETSATLKNSPDFSRTLTSLKTDALAALGKTEEAVALMMGVAQQGGDPYYVLDALTKASEIYVRKQEMANAAQVFVDYLAKNPDYERTYDLKILAGMYYNMAETLTPEQIETQKRLLNEAVGEMEKLLASKGVAPEERDRVHFGKATAFRLLNRETEALDLLTSLSQRQSVTVPVRANAIFDLGQHYQEKGQFQKAKEMYQKMLVQFSQYQDIASRAQYSLNLLSQIEAQQALGATTQPTQPTTGPTTAATSPAAEVPATAPVAQ